MAEEFHIDPSIMPPGGGATPDQSVIDMGAGVTPDIMSQMANPPQVDIDDFSGPIHQQVMADNPEYFSNPGLPTGMVPSSANIDAISNDYLNSSHGAINPMKLGMETMGNFHTAQYGMNQFVDRYEHHNKFSQLGFSPFRDNETLYNEASSGWDEFKRAAGQWTTLAGLGFKDAMTFGDLTDRETAEKFEYAMNVGSSTDTGAFGTNLFLNSGYTVGIMGELIMEEVGLALAAGAMGIAAPFTGGATAPGAAAAVGAMGVRGARAFGKVHTAWQAAKNLGKTIKSFKDINKARQFFGKAGKATLNFINPLENTMKFGKHYKGYRRMDGASSLGKLKTATRGFGDFYRDVRNIRLAFGEGSLEGGMVQNKMEKDLFDEWRANNPGKRITDKEAQTIKDTARSAGVTTTLTNAPVIMLSNKIVLDGLLRPQYLSRKLVGDVIESGLGKKILFNPKKALKDAYSALPEGFLAQRWAYAKNPRLWLAGAQKYTSANFAEGLQEIAQESIAGTNESYYTAQYQGDITRGGYYSHMVTNIGHQFSAQGFETFMSGFLMGGIAGPVSTAAGGLISTGTELFDANSELRVKGVGFGDSGTYRVGGSRDAAKLSKFEKIKEQREEKLNDVINTLNQFNANPEQYLSPELENLIAQKEYGTLMKAAEETGDTKAYNDFKNSAGFKHVMTALRYGRLGTHISQLEELSKLTEEEVKQSWGLSKEEYDNEIGSAIARAKRIESRYEKAKELFPNPFDPSNYADDSDIWKAEAINKMSWESAIEEFVFNQDSFDNALERTEKILNKAKDKANLENTPYSEFSSTFSLEDTQSEIDLLELEIKALEEGGTKKSDKSLKFLKRKKEKLEQYATAMEAVKVERLASETEEVSQKTKNKAKTAFKRYVRALATENGDYTTDENLDDVFDDIMDAISLDERKRKANNAVNILLNPEVFHEKVNRIAAIKTQLYNNKKDEIRKSLEKYLKAMDKNEMLQELHKLGMFFDISELDALDKENKPPKTFFYVNPDSKKAPNVSALEVQQNSADYLAAIALVKKYYEALTGMPITQEQIGDVYNASVRSKKESDNRTYKDLAEQYGFDPNAVETTLPLKQVLEAIIDPENTHATDKEKLLAAKLLEIAVEGETITFTSTMAKPGEYTEAGQTKIDARFSATDYDKKPIIMMSGEGVQAHAGRDLPIEFIILREEINRRTLEALAENGEFNTQITELRKKALEEFDKRAKGNEDLPSETSVTSETERLRLLEELLSEDHKETLALYRKKGQSEKRISDFIKDKAKETAKGNTLSSQFQAEDILANPQDYSEALVVNAWKHLNGKRTGGPIDGGNAENNTRLLLIEIKEDIEKGLSINSPSYNTGDKKGVREAYEGVKDAENSKGTKQEIDWSIFALLQDNQAFVSGVMTSGALKEFLASIDSPIKVDTKNSWQTFVDYVLEALKVKFGNKPNGTVLNAAMDLITAKIDEQYGDSGAQPATTSANTETTPEPSATEGPISTKIPATKLYKEHKTFMTEMVELYKEYNRQREADGNDPLGKYEGKPYDIMKSNGFKQWWSMPFTNKIEAINKKNAELVGTSEGPTTQSTDFTNKEVEEIRASGKIEKARLVTLADKIRRGQSLTLNEKAVLAIPAIEAQYKALNENRENFSTNKPSHITVDMRNGLRKLGWNDVLINKMSVDEALQRIADNVPLSKLQEIKSKEQIKKSSVLGKQRTELRDNISKDFNEAENLEDLEAAYNFVVTSLQENKNDFSNILDRSTFDVQALYDKNLKRLADEVSMSKLYEGVGVVLITKGKNKFAVVESLEGDISFPTSVVLRVIETNEKIIVTAENLDKNVKYIYSKEMVKAAEIENKSETVVPEVTKEVADNMNKSEEVVSDQLDADQIIAAMEAAKKQSEAERNSSFLDSVSKRCKK